MHGNPTVGLNCPLMVGFLVMQSAVYIGESQLIRKGAVALSFPGIVLVTVVLIADLKQTIQRVVLSIQRCKSYCNG